MVHHAQSQSLSDKLQSLTTPHLADACMLLHVAVRFAPVDVRPLAPQMRCTGLARPVRHSGNIDVFLEAFDNAEHGDVLVIDNSGRLDEACIGDIITLEARAAGLGGIVIWGLHRDGKELSEIAFPVFSLGALSAGPRRLNTRPADTFTQAIIGEHAITRDDFVVGDSNGVLFLPQHKLAELITSAAAIKDMETKQMAAMAAGHSFRRQIQFDKYLARRERDPHYELRQHLQALQSVGEA